MNEPDVSGNFSSTLAAYLSTLLTVGDCVANASPEVGAHYKQRLNRLRARVAFQPTEETITEATATIDTELREFAAAATRQAARQSAELRREISSFGEIIERLAHRQDFYANRLRQFAAQIESTRYPTDPEHLAEIVALQSSGLRSCVESMSNETASLVARMRQETSAVDERLASVKCMDPLTGLINRKEMTEQIAACRTNGAVFSLLLFAVSPPERIADTRRTAEASANTLGDPMNHVMRQAADRLLTQFRLSDRVARWAEREFMVLFQGPSNLAESRAQQVLPWVTGSYGLDSSEVLQVSITVRLFEHEAALV